MDESGQPGDAGPGRRERPEGGWPAADAGWSDDERPDWRRSRYADLLTPSAAAGGNGALRAPASAPPYPYEGDLEDVAPPPPGFRAAPEPRSNGAPPPREPAPDEYQGWSPPAAEERRWSSTWAPSWARSASPGPERSNGGGLRPAEPSSPQPDAGFPPLGAVAAGAPTDSGSTVRFPATPDPLAPSSPPPPSMRPASAPPSAVHPAPVHPAPVYPAPVRPASAPPAPAHPASAPPAPVHPASAPPATVHPASGPPISGPPISGPPISGRPASGPPASGPPASGSEASARANAPAYPPLPAPPSNLPPVASWAPQWPASSPPVAVADTGRRHRPAEPMSRPVSGGGLPAPGEIVRPSHADLRGTELPPAPAPPAPAPPKPALPPQPPARPSVADLLARNGGTEYGTPAAATPTREPAAPRVEPVPAANAAPSPPRAEPARPSGAVDGNGRLPYPSDLIARTVAGAPAPTAGAVPGGSDVRMSEADTESAESLPQRVPAEPDVPTAPEPPSDQPAEAPQLARIATHLRRDDVPPARERPEGFDVKAILAAVQGVTGVRDASLRKTPAGAHSLRLDLADGADPAEVSRQVARLLQDRMGLAAAPQNLPTETPPGWMPRDTPLDVPPADVPRRRRGETHRGRAPVVSRPEPAEAAFPPFGGAAGAIGSVGGSPVVATTRQNEAPASRPLNPGAQPGPRVVIDHVQVSTFGLDATVEVRFGLGELRASGVATGPAVDNYVLRLCAVAAASALDQILRTAGNPAEQGRCFVENAAVVPFGNCEVAVVVVLLVCGGWVEQLAGSALVAGDPRQAVVRATLDAVNRRLEALLS